MPDSRQLPDQGAARTVMCRACGATEVVAEGSHLASLEADVARLRAALEPLVRGNYGPSDLRRAREALSGGEPVKQCCNTLDASLEPCPDCPENWNGGEA